MYSEDDNGDRWEDQIVPREEDRWGREVGSYATTKSSEMMFNYTQITAFFTEANQMGLSARIHQVQYNEGISTLANLHEWEDDEWDQFT